MLSFKPHIIFGRTVMQSSDVDCGPAALLTVLRQYGSTVNLGEIQEKYVSDARGATLHDLYRAAVDYGFDAMAARGSLDDLEKEALPCIAHVVNGAGQPHFVVVYSIGRGVHIGDPAVGSRRISRLDFERIWASRAVLLVRPKVHKRKSAHSGLRRWIYEQSAPLSQFWWLLGMVSVVSTGLTLLWSLVVARVLSSPQSKSSGQLLGLALGLFALVFLRGGIAWVRVRLADTAGGTFEESLRKRLAQMVRKIPASMLRSNTAGMIRARLTDIQQVNTTAIRAATVLAADTALVVSCQIALALLSPIYLAIAATISFLLVAWLLWRNETFREARFDYLAKARLVDDRVSELSQALPELRGLDCEEFALQRMLASTDDIAAINRTLTRHASVTSVLAEVTTNILLAFVAMTGVFAISTGKVSSATAFVLFVIASTTVPGIIRIVESIESIQVALLSAGRLFEADAAADVPPASCSVSEVGYIELTDLEKATSSGHVLFSGITRRLERGTVTVLSGTSGSGKTVLLSIIAGITRPTSGSVVIARYGYSQATSGHVKGIPLVPAAPAIFVSNLFENIQLGRSWIGRQEVEDLLALLGLDKFLQEFPQRFDTQLQRQPRSTTSGQTQIIGLLRALAGGPNIVLLDDCMSAVDPPTTMKILERITKLPTRPIVVVASNSQAIINSADYHLNLTGLHNEQSNQSIHIVP